MPDKKKANNNALCLINAQKVANLGFWKIGPTIAL